MCHGGPLSGSAMDPHRAPNPANMNNVIRLRTRNTRSRTVNVNTDVTRRR